MLSAAIVTLSRAETVTPSVAYTDTSSICASSFDDDSRMASAAVTAMLSDEVASTCPPVSMVILAAASA